MGLFTRMFDDPGHPGQGSAAPVPHVSDDSTDALRRKHAAVIGEINRHGQDLPAAGTVLARRITDAAGAVLRRDDVEHLDPYARITLNAMLSDYLPTAVRTAAAATRSGHPDDAALVEQLTALHDAAATIVAATQDSDVQALQVQAGFLRTKFTGSDLDL